MKKYFMICLGFVCGCFSSITFAMDFDPTSIIDALTKIYGVNFDIKNLNGDILTTDKDQLKSLNALLNGLTGTHTYGNMLGDTNQFSWGEGADRLDTMLSLYKASSGGKVAQTSQHLEKQFPIAEHLGSTSETENSYYLLQAQTTLASRAASQVAFEQISKESDVVQSLQNEIDKAKDNKSAVDLNNRLLAEQNKLSIQQSKLLAILVQQNAVDSQEKANFAKEDAAFLEIK